MKFTPDAELQAIAEASARDACEFVRDQFHVTLDWSDGSIRHIERALDAFHRLGPTAKPSGEQATAFAKMFGSYVGEVYRRNHGAVWGMVERNGQRSPGLQARSFDTIFPPLERAYSRIVQGPENNVSDYYSDLVRRSANPPPPLPVQRLAPKNRLAAARPAAARPNSPPTTIGWLRRHFVNHGLLSLGLALFSLLWIRGFDWRALFIFGVPTLLALAHARLGKSVVAEAFLISIAAASVIALVRWLFPRLGMDNKTMTTGHDSRLRNLYLCIYMLWVLAVLPVYAFGGSLRAKWRGEIPKLSPFTCYLGIFTVGLFWVGVLFTPNRIIRSLGLWPVF